MQEWTAAIKRLQLPVKDGTGVLFPDQPVIHKDTEVQLEEASSLIMTLGGSPQPFSFWKSMITSLVLVYQTKDDVHVGSTDTFS